jgi:hypothetical protein
MLTCILFDLCHVGIKVTKLFSLLLTLQGAELVSSLFFSLILWLPTYCFVLEALFPHDLTISSFGVRTFAD